MPHDPIDRRTFLGGLAAGSLAASAALAADAPKPAPPLANRKVRVGLVGYGYCKFSTAFGFQDHPNVQVVAVSDLIPDRRDGLKKAARCDKSYDSLEELVKDPSIEAVFVATDAPSHARHCIDCLNHGKHVMVAVPAVWGSLEDADKLIEAVRKSGLKYMMAETSCYRADCHAMRTAYQAGAFGRLVYSEGEYHHYHDKPIPSYKDWRVALPPLWYATHATAYYVGVTGKRLTTVSCLGVKGPFAEYQPGANAYNNTFIDEIALYGTSEGGTSRMVRSGSIFGLVSETGRVFGQKGWMDGVAYKGQVKSLPKLDRPPLPPGVPAGGHGGSHGYLSHEFISAILEDRRPLVDVYEALAMTVPGILAHTSALKDGETLKIPTYERPTA